MRNLRFTERTIEAPKIGVTLSQMKTDIVNCAPIPTVISQATRMIFTVPFIKLNFLVRLNSDYKVAETHISQSTNQNTPTPTIIDNS